MLKRDKYLTALLGGLPLVVALVFLVNNTDTFEFHLLGTESLQSNLITGAAILEGFTFGFFFKLVKNLSWIWLSVLGVMILIGLLYFILPIFRKLWKESARKSIEYQKDSKNHKLEEVNLKSKRENIEPMERWKDKERLHLQGELRSIKLMLEKTHGSDVPSFLDMSKPPVIEVEDSFGKDNISVSKPVKYVIIKKPIGKIKLKPKKKQKKRQIKKLTRKSTRKPAKKATKKLIRQLNQGLVNQKLINQSSTKKELFEQEPSKKEPKVDTFEAELSRIDKELSKL